MEITNTDPITAPPVSYLTTPAAPGDAQSSFTTSPNVGKLITALLKARAEFKTVFRTKRNEFKEYNYAALDDIQDATVESLTKHGLAVVQSPASKDTDAVVTTTLYHESGEYFRSVISGPAKDPKGSFNIQTVGLGITYLRRYAYQAMLNITIKNDDDDGAALVNEESKQPAKRTAAPPVNHQPAQPKDAPRPGEEKHGAEKSDQHNLDISDDDLPENMQSPQDGSEDTSPSADELPLYEERRKYAERLRKYGVDKESLKAKVLKIAQAASVTELTKGQWKTVFDRLDAAAEKGKDYLNQFIKED